MATFVTGDVNKSEEVHEVKKAKTEEEIKEEQKNNLEKDVKDPQN